MKKFVILGVFLLASGYALFVLAGPAAPEDGIEMNVLKKTVIFNHSTHKEADCVTCHHLVNDNESYAKCSAAECHDNFDPKDKSMNSFYQAMHKPKGSKFATCISCHTNVAGNDKDKKKDLVGCAKSKCHP